MEDRKTIRQQQEFTPLLKIALEMGPLVIFFAANSMKGIFYATAALMIATAISLLASWVFLKRIPVMPLVTGVFVMVFGSLTIYLQDATFMKIKPTILNLLFAAGLAGGLIFGKLLLKIVLGEVLQMQEEGWRILTLRWIGFFIFLAILNEIVWRSFSQPTWVAFKSFGVMPLTFLFMMSQISLIMKYQTAEVSSAQSEI